MKVVKVYGALRDLLGQGRFEFVAETPAQAVRALLVNHPALQQWLIDSESRGIGFRVMVSKQKIHQGDLSGMFMPWSEQEVLSIAPVMVGAGGSTTQILLGVAFIGLSFVTFGGGFLGGTGLGTSAQGLVQTATATGIYASAGSAALGVIGAGLVLSGVAGIISPVPGPPREATRLESNSFSGIANTQRQGVPVPIAYGRVFVGSAVISAGLDVDQV